MSKSNCFRPNWTSPPGSTIADILSEQQISVGSFASMMELSIAHTNNILKGHSSITQDIAQQLSICLGASQEFWINREQQYQEDIVYLRNRKQEQEKNTWLNALPIKDMIKLGWINQVEDKLSECLRFFNVPNIETWRGRYESELELVKFRASAAYKAQPAATAAWIRQGEIQGEMIHCKPWNASLFQESLASIRPLTRQKDPQVFLPKLTEICASCGVALAIVRTPTGCYASGATKFVSSDKALLLLSFRYLTDDHFWFTFFHEAGHLLLHGKDGLFIEGEVDDIWDEREKEANEFSAEVLIPSDFRYKLSKIPLNKRGIIKFALDLGISPGIVVGQLQFSKRIKPQGLNSFKRRYTWSS